MSDANWDINRHQQHVDFCKRWYTVPPDDYDRARACVNALAGLNPDGVAGLIRAATRILGGTARYFGERVPPDDPDYVSPHTELTSALAAIREGGGE